VLAGEMLAGFLGGGEVVRINWIFFRYEKNIYCFILGGFLLGLIFAFGYFGGYYVMVSFTTVILISGMFIGLFLHLQFHIVARSPTVTFSIK